MEWAALVKLEFTHLDLATQWNVLRLMLGALQVHYALLGGDEVDEDGVARKGISDDEWRAIRTRHLLSRDEIGRLSAYSGFKPFLPVGWALAEVKNILLSMSGERSGERKTALGDDMAVRAVFGSFCDVAFRFRSHSSATFNLLNAPVPFAYFHVMKLLLLLSLLIISYALIELLHGETVLSSIVFALISLVMVGLSEIAIVSAAPRALRLAPDACAPDACARGRLFAAPLFWSPVERSPLCVVPFDDPTGAVRPVWGRRQRLQPRRIPRRGLRQRGGVPDRRPRAAVLGPAERHAEPARGVERADAQVGRPRERRGLH
jgi:hypothetical protein